MNFFKAIFFDFNGTLIDIRTDENVCDIYRTVANLLSGYGFPYTEHEFRTRFYEIMKEQRAKNPQDHPEFDVVGIFRNLLENGKPSPRLTKEKLALLPEFLAETYRAASMFQLKTYEDVHEVLDKLQREYLLAGVSDAQRIWAEAELEYLDLTRYFPVHVISSELGVRKPNRLLFETALKRLNLRPEEVIFVGNDMHRDVYGAGRLGFKTVFFRSNQGDWNSRGIEPDYIIYHFRELLNAVEFLERKQAESIR